MKVDIDCGQLGYQCVDIDTCDLDDVDCEDLLILFDNLNKEQKAKFLLKLRQEENINLEYPKALLSYYLNTLDCDVAKQILVELNQEFLSTKEWQDKLRSINE